MLTLSGGLAYRQLFQYKEYLDREKRQAQRLIVYPGPRGNIFDRNGELLVGNRPRFSAVVYPDDLNQLRRSEFYPDYILRRRAFDQAIREGKKEPPKTTSELVSKLVWEARQSVLQSHLDRVNDLTGRNEVLDLRRLQRHYNEERLLPLTLMDDLTPEEYAILVEQLSPNSPVKIRTESARFYPHGNAASHTLGYVVNRFVEDEEVESDAASNLMTFKLKGKVGRAGIERHFDERLKGAAGTEIYRVDKSGYREGLVELHRPSKGADLVTSLDLRMQLAAEGVVGDKTGAVIALKVDTGEILTLVSKPDYNLNDMSPFISHAVYQDINDRGAWINRATQGLYPPGSTFKVITSIADLKHDIIEPDTRLESGKYFRVGNRLFPCHSDYGYGVIDVAEALSVSANVFFYRTGMDLGIDRLSAEAKRFGIDKRIDLELPFMASRMIVPSKAWKRENGRGGWVPGDTANTSIGQGFLLTTPMHMALVAASVARGETRTQPTLNKLPVGVAVDHATEPIGLQPEEYQAIIDGMELAVTEGTAKLVQVPGLRIAGKTGTAQVKIKGEDSTLAWFIGFAPVEEPQVAVCVMIEGTQPGDNFHGGSTAGPVAHEVFKTWFADFDGGSRALLSATE